MKFILGFGLLIVLTLNGCEKANNNSTHQAMSEKLEAVEASANEDQARLEADYAAEKPPYDKLPPIPVYANCDNQVSAECKINRYTLLMDWPKAWQGDYQAQRNVAYLQSTQSSGVIDNKVQGCAWRIIIMMSGHPQYFEGDGASYNIECGRLSSADFTAAKQVAKTNFKKIKGESMPLVPEPNSKGI